MYMGSQTIQLTLSFLLFNVADLTYDTIGNLQVFTVAANMLLQVCSQVRMLRIASETILHRFMIDWCECIMRLESSPLTSLTVHPG